MCGRGCCNRAGFTVREASNGAMALQRIAEERPTLVLLDVKLPDIDGFEVCRQIKTNPATASIIVVQISAAFVAKDDKVRGLEGGADGYLTDPVAPDELVATINAFAAHTSGRGKTRSSECGTGTPGARVAPLK